MTLHKIMNIHKKPPKIGGFRKMDITYAGIEATMFYSNEPLAKPTLNKINRRKNRLGDLQFRGFARGSNDTPSL